VEGKILRGLRLPATAALVRLEAQRRLAVGFCCQLFFSQGHLHMMGEHIESHGWSLENGHGIPHVPANHT